MRYLSGFLCAVILSFMAVGPAVAAEKPAFIIELKDGVITPSRLEVPAGTTFKIILRNTGESPAEFESLRLRKEKIIGPGIESFIVIRRLSPGSYEFFDDFHLDMDTARAIIIAK